MLKFTQDHEWLRIEGNVATVGITAHASGQLGDIVFVELPEIGKTFAKGDAAAIVESVKAASEIYAPVAGAIISTNSEIVSNPALVNQDSQGEGWFFKMRVDDPFSLDGLMDEDAYKALVDSGSNGPSPREIDEMLKVLGAFSLDAFIDETVPASIRQPRPLDWGLALTEREALEAVRATANLNRNLVSLIGQGYYSAGDPKKHSREPGLVHGIHALPARDQPRAAGSTSKLPDHDFGPDRA